MRKPVKLRTSWSLMHKIFFSIRYFILYKYFENNYVLPIMFWVMFYLSCFGYVLPVIYVDIFIFCLFALTLINAAPLFLLVFCLGCVHLFCLRMLFSFREL